VSDSSVPSSRAGVSAALRWTAPDAGPEDEPIVQHRFETHRASSALTFLSSGSHAVLSAVPGRGRNGAFRADERAARGRPRGPLQWKNKWRRCSLESQPREQVRMSTEAQVFGDRPRVPSFGQRHERPRQTPIKNQSFEERER
jgi:hypothetical protein